MQILNITTPLFDSFKAWNKAIDNQSIDSQYVNTKIDSQYVNTKNIKMYLESL